MMTPSSHTSDTITRIEKRDGRVVDFDPMRITVAIRKAILAVRGDEDGEAQEYTNEVVRRLNDQFGAHATPSVEEIQDIVEEVLMDVGEVDVAKSYILYREERRRIREEKYRLWADRVDSPLKENALKVLESRYLRRNEEGKVIETPQELFRRVAENIAAAEKIYNTAITDDELLEQERRFYNMMASLRFLPNSPTLMNAGAPLQQLSACFVLPWEDNLESIFDGIKHAAMIHQSGGGTGVAGSRLRPRGDVVKSTGGVASGPVSFLKAWDAATETIKQGGKRRGANMGVLRVDHPDVFEFIQAKTEEGELENFNISVAITDVFMEALRNDEEYDLVNPRSGQPVRSVPAREVWDMIVNYAWRTGDPGVLFLDRMNNDRGNSTKHIAPMEATNPCGEVPLQPYDSCNLGSIDVGKFYDAETDDVDWDALRETTHLATNFLDNVIDMNRYPLPEIEKMSRGNRRLGLGVMGFADLLVRLRIPYGSKKSIDFADKLMGFIDSEAKKASERLAEVRGVFPHFKGSTYDAPDKPNLRNCALTTIAPTGTIGIIAGCSQGCEPIFALAYRRYSHIGRGSDEWVELLEVNPLFEEIARREGFYSKELMEQVAETGSVQGVDAVPQEWQEVFVTAHDLSPDQHVRIQAAFQRHIDNGVSKTINFREDATVEEVDEAYRLAYDLGCKGITIYRSGSKSQQVLNVGTKEAEKEEEKEGEGKHLKERDVSPEIRDPEPSVPDVEHNVA